MQKFNLTFKPEGICQCKNRSTCLKLVCPLFSYKSRKCTCSCPQPCISSKSGTIVTYTMITFVLSPGINRNSQELLNLYKNVLLSSILLLTLNPTWALTSYPHVTIFHCFLISHSLLYLSSCCLFSLLLLNFIVLNLLLLCYVSNSC